MLSPYLHPNSSVLDVGCGSGYLLACLHRMIYPPSQAPSSPILDTEAEVIAPNTNTTTSASASDSAARGERRRRRKLGKAKVVGIDHVAKLTALTISNLKSDGFRSTSFVTGGTTNPGSSSVDAITIDELEHGVAGGHRGEEVGNQGLARSDLTEIVDKDKGEDEAEDEGIEGGGGDEREIVVVTGDGRAGFPTTGPYNLIHIGASSPSGIPRALVNQLSAPGVMFIPIGQEGGQQWVYKVLKDADGKITSEKMVSVRYVPLKDL